jgi:hypothetical protein
MGYGMGVPDSRSHRGAHPEDAKDFAEPSVPRLQSAVRELSYLFTHEYSEVAAVKLVGDHHQLTARQRQAVLRAACSDLALRERAQRRVAFERLAGTEVGVDGFNCLITIESMLSRAPVFVGRDGALRDLASVHGTYRSVEETRPAALALGRALTGAGVRAAHVFLDRPVGNSGRLRALLLELFASGPLEVSVSLHDQVDHELVETCALVASADAFILDNADGCLDLSGLVIASEGLTPWLVDLRTP